MEEILQKIKEQVENNRVVLYMKGTPEQPLCGFSARAVQILQLCGVDEIFAVDVIGQPEYREAIKVFSNWPTIPQLYIDGEFIGGSDIMLELYQMGELQKKLARE